MDRGLRIGTALLVGTLLMTGTVVGLALHEDASDDATSDAQEHGHSQDTVDERTPGVTVVEMAVNSTAYRISEMSEHRTLEADAFEIDREQRTITTEAPITWEQANGALLVEDADTMQLVVAEENVLGVDVAREAETSPVFTIYLLDTHTDITASQDRCEVSLRPPSQSQGAGGIFAKLLDPGERAEVTVDATEGCPGGTMALTHLGTDWSWR